MRTETLQRGTRFSVILLVCAAALLSAFGQAASASTLTVRVLDVGQGDSIFVVFPEGGTMLVDAGSRFATLDPTTWPEQARLLAEGRWDEFKALTGETARARAGGDEA